MFVLFSVFFAILNVLVFLEKWGYKPHTKAVKQDLQSHFSLKKCGSFEKKMRTNLTSDRCRRLFNGKLCFCIKHCGLFGLFSRDKGDQIDVWMIKITSKQIKSKCMFASFKSRLHTTTMFVPSVEIVKCGFLRKLKLLPLSWHANTVDEN